MEPTAMAASKHTPLPLRRAGGTDVEDYIVRDDVQNTRDKTSEYKRYGH